MENNNMQKNQIKIVISEEQQLKNQQQLVHNQYQSIQKQQQNLQHKQEFSRRCSNIQIIDKERKLSIPILDISKSPLLNRRFNENTLSSQHSFRDTERKIMQIQMVEVNRSSSMDILSKPRNFNRTRSQSKYVTELSRSNVQENVIKKEENAKMINQQFKTFHLFRFFTNEIFIVSALVLIVILFQNLYMNVKN